MNDATATSDPGRYAEVNGLRLYYEVHGTGAPLVLLHGGVAGLAMLGTILPALAATRQVIAVELQGHGRTADVDRPLRYETMADDIAALLAHLGIERADVMGYSLGGGVALQTVIRYPDRVRKLVVMSTVYARQGWYPEVLADFDRMGPETGAGMAQSPLAQIYPAVSWPDLFAKIGDLQRQPYDWSREIPALPMPVLLVFADADAVRMEHIMAFYALLGGGQRDAGLDGALRPMAHLAIMPGCTHYDIIASPALAPTVTPFLDSTMSRRA
jgi:pimeloyl-ACP methyl ester carboxylesterase